MGQKVNPIGFRVGVKHDWRSVWYAEGREYGDQLLEDLEIRDFVKKRLQSAAVSRIVIERWANRMRLRIFTARPGIVIGRKGEAIDRLRTELSKKVGKEVAVEIQEIKVPETDAQLVAENVALQLERRISFRRAMKRAVNFAMERGAAGIRLHAAGRLGGAELGRKEGYRQGKVPLHTLDADIDYGFAEARTIYGTIGVKCWICHEKKDEAAAGGSKQRKEVRRAPDA